MKLYLILMAAVVSCQMSLAFGRYNITCYYDTFSIQRGGFANFTENDLRTSLEYCTHVIYGYIGLTPNTYELEILHPKQHLLFTQVRKLKNQYRHIKFLASLGGDKDTNQPEKYLKLLESPAHQQQNFINSARIFLQKYSFDGLDLAYQFPHSQSKRSNVAKFLKKVKKVLKNTPSRHHAYDEHRQQFTTLVNKIRQTLRRDRLMLTLTILPHVNATKFINIPAIINNIDFVNLATFDYTTPEGSPHAADYFAPIHSPYRKSKHISSVDHDVRQWLSQHIQPGKINVGVATYGRSWKMSKELKSTVMPVNSSLDGPAQGGELTHTPGLLSWPEICFKLPKMTKFTDKKYGNYAFRSAAVRGQQGLFITYEDRASIGAKAAYVVQNSLGGMALFDLSLDDFRGKCKEATFPALKAIKFSLH